jgi:hypothetical protein
LKDLAVAENVRVALAAPGALDSISVVPDSWVER